MLYCLCLKTEPCHAQVSCITLFSGFLFLATRLSGVPHRDYRPGRRFVGLAQATPHLEDQGGHQRVGAPILKGQKGAFH